MASSRVSTFNDPDEFGASFVGTNVDFTILGRGQFEAKLYFIEFERLNMRRFSDNLPRIGHTADVFDQATIAFRTQPGPRMLREGMEMGTGSIIRRKSSGFQKSEGLAAVGMLSLSVEELSLLGEAITGCDLTPPNDAVSVTPPPDAMAKLQQLHAAAGLLAEYAPSVLAHPEAARGLEQALIEAMVTCLASSAPGEDKSAVGQHAKIMRRFHRSVEENQDNALFIPELCAAIGASERTLRVCCQEQLGVSPKRYLLLRRMHLVRRRLRENAPTQTTVTEIATRYGFWQFGRFAGEYKSLFGELPSTTLGRPIA